MHGFGRTVKLVAGISAVLAAAWAGPRGSAPATRPAATTGPSGADADWPIPVKPGARRVHYENYEDGKCDRVRKNTAAAVVSRKQGADVVAGKYCLRGNFDPKTTDPITGIKAAAKSTKLRAITLAGTTVRDELYISLLWRLDPGTTFEVDRSGPGAAPSYKLAYITGTGRPWAENVNVVPGQSGGPAGWYIANNIPNPKQTPFKARGKVGRSEARTGVWHRVEIYLKLESTPGAGDGVGIVRVDGRTCIDRRDLIYLWKGGQRQSWGRLAIPSMFGGAFPPKRSFGWQLDELEVWDGLPPRSARRPFRAKAPPQQRTPTTGPAPSATPPAPAPPRGPGDAPLHLGREFGNSLSVDAHRSATQVLLQSLSE